MKSFAILVLIFIFALTGVAQKPKTAKKKLPAAPTQSASTGNEKEEFEKAIAVADAGARIAALQKFIENYPKSTEIIRAQELIVSARAAVGDEKLRLNETAEGVELFKLAVKDAPQPMSEKIFGEIIINFPTNLFWRGQRTEALEIARLIEAKADGNAKQLLGLATFYLGTENGVEAKRLAEKAIALDANLPAAHQTLGLAHRVSFQLEESANAYQKALELAPDSVVSKRSLAEMKRAVGKSDEAAALYREILEKDANDGLAQTGLVLSLFGAGKRAEAETEMNKAFEANPNNLVLLVGAAHWYAAQQTESAKAVELAQKAVAIEPRYTWAHIALARALLQQKRPLDAERTLLAARQYGNFPTLDYEIASARMQAGFFRDAVDILKPNFTVADGTIKTKLGGRVSKEAANFTDLLALERRASIFEMASADNTEIADKLKKLLVFNQKIETGSEEEIASAADEFAVGDDKMNLHRKLYAANALLQNKKSLPKALELAQSAVGKAETALEVPNASAAVLADELYESRTASMSRNQFVIVPEIPRQTLLAILRGRIEEITGWTLYQQNKLPEAAVRLRRAVSVLPEKSAWWRSSMWRLGSALEADGKDKDALDSYVKGYPTDAPDGLKYSIIESLYQKINGNNEGLEAKIGAKPASAFNLPTETQKPITTAQTVAQNIEPPNQTGEVKKPETDNSNAPEIKPEPSPVVESTPEPTSEPTSEPTPEPTPEITPQPQETPQVLPSPTPAPEIVLDTATEQKQPNPETISQNTSTEEITKPTEESTENKAVEQILTPAKPVEKPVEIIQNPDDTKEKPKSIFDPVIIRIPNNEPLKMPNPKTADSNQSKTSEEKSEIPTNETVSAGLVRPRVIIEDPFAKPKTETCEITVSQENVSLLNGGGSLGILVGFEDKSGDLKQIKAVSSSPNDVEITLEPEIGALSGRAFFVIRSVSSNIGEYKITFEAACGKREIQVTVR